MFRVGGIAWTKNDVRLDSCNLKMIGRVAREHSEGSDKFCRHTALERLDNGKPKAPYVPNVGADYRMCNIWHQET